MIITIARECGSGGHEIGEKLAKRFELELYDKHILIEETKKLGKYEEMARFYEETPIDSLLYAIAMGIGTNQIGKLPFEMIKELASQKSFVIIGRCSNYVLRNYPDFTSVYIHGETESKVKRTMQKQMLSEKKALELIKQVDKKRATYHKYYTDEIWGDAKNYQITLNSSLIGVDKSVDMIAEYIKCKKY
ncbi:MAG: AAA family ATPase [Lachnotalea sp.]